MQPRFFEEKRKYMRGKGVKLIFEISFTTSEKHVNELQLTILHSCLKEIEIDFH